MHSNTPGRKGFTLIELLVVIAIIAILAAILFPVFAKVRESVRRSTCMSQMHEIHTDLALYREDFGKYPSILMCIPYVAGSPQIPFPSNGLAPLTALGVHNRPFGLKKYNKDVSLFYCPDNPINSQTTVVTGAVYPPGVPASLINATNGPYPNAPYSPSTLAHAYFYKFDSYDTGPQISATGDAVPGVTELHYALDWTGTVAANDPPNQLKYPDPPQDTTVVTWCTYHVAVAHGDQIPTLLLNGSVRSVPYKQVVQGPGPSYWPLNFAP